MLSTVNQNDSYRDNSRNSNTNVRGRSDNIQFAQIPIPHNNDFSNLAGFDSSRPTLLPSRKSPHYLAPHIACTRCNHHHRGHYASGCPFLLTERPQLFQKNLVSMNPIYGPGCIIIDSGSSFNSVHDISLLTNPTPCPPFESHSNGGGFTYTTYGTMLLFPELTAYHNNECLVNIIPLDLLQAKYHVYFDSAVANSYRVVLLHRSLWCWNSLPAPV